MTSGHEEWSWNGVSDEATREMMRLAELQLNDLLAASLAADQRATNQCGVLAGFGAALLTAAATLWLADEQQANASISALTAGVGMLVAAFISALAARPTAYMASGYEPRKLISVARDASEMLKGVIEDMQMRITHNRASLETSARLTGAATGCAFASIVVAAIIFVALQAS